MTLVFDAQALVAYFKNEPGASAVRDMLDAVEAGREDAWCSTVNFAEVHYLVWRHRPDQAVSLMQWLMHLGIQVAETADVWMEAAEIKAEHPMPLADCFALATAKALDATLVAGSDVHFDAAPSLGVELRRI